MRVEVEQLCRLLRLDNRGTLWHGHERVGSSKEGDSLTDEESSLSDKRATALQRVLGDFLYFRYYACGGYRLGHEGNRLCLSMPSRRSQIQELRKFVGSSLESDWRVTAENSEKTFRRAGVSFSLGENAEPGSHRVAKESNKEATIVMNGIRPNMSGGFVFIRGRRVLAQGERLLRTYVNIHECDRVGFAKELYSCLIQSEVAFDFKVMLGSDNLSRCDNLVLYSQRSDCTSVTNSVLKALSRAGCRVRSPVPLWTDKLSAGVAVADDPSNGASFGRHRCESLSTALIDSLLKRETRVADSRGVARCLERSGINLDKPYVVDMTSLQMFRDIELVSQSETHSPPAREKLHPSFNGTTGGRIRNALEMISGHISRTAIRWENRLTWLSQKASARPSIGGAVTSPYSGLAGIALFFGEYGRVTGDQIACELARQIWGEIITRHRQQEEAPRLSLLAGTVGTALVGIRLSRLLPDQALLSQSKNLLDELLASAEQNDNQELDWLGGIAGAMSGLIVAGRSIRKEGRLEDFAAGLSKRVLLAGRNSERGVCWRGSHDKRIRPMLGLAHGTSGIGLAMALTGEAHSLNLAQQAFSYEDSMFSDKEKAWPVFRNGKVSYQKAWCHGSAGIMLCRKFAHELNGNMFPWRDFYSTSLSNLLETTTERLPRNPNLSLCHGIAGNAEILQICGTSLKQDLSVLVDHVCLDVENEIRCADARGDSLDPSLMLGLSGIGIFLIRQLDPNTPSPLELGTPNWLQE